eukprot:GHVP01048041.1.p1 GENE.GHVP01048041.1~~GHVP01048041.1.p1  ORF type:complete len:273 (-),score=44.99 GHVP01048041.1:60-878(-)
MGFNVHYFGDSDSESSDNERTHYTGGRISGVAVNSPKPPSNNIQDAILDKAYNNINSESNSLSNSSSIDKTLILYKNGYIIINPGEIEEDNILYLYEIEENKWFLSEIYKGYYPGISNNNNQINVNLIDRKNIMFNNSNNCSGFKGKSYKVNDKVNGKTNDKVDDKTNDTTRNAINTDKTDRIEKRITKTDKDIVIIRVKLPNGLTKNIPFNGDETIGDIYKYLKSFFGDGIILSSGFPPKEIDLPMDTVINKSALIGCLIYVKLTDITRLV